MELKSLTFCKTLEEDVAYIEAQGQGLQIQASNQKLLQAELKSLLEYVSIADSQLVPLRQANLESNRELEQTEASLVMLFKAMVNIDPTLGIPPHVSEDNIVSPDQTGRFGSSELAGMRVVREAQRRYAVQAMAFLQRIGPFLEDKFEAAIGETKKAIESNKDGNLSRRAGKAQLELKHYDLARNPLWRYGPILLFAREVNKIEWINIIESYGTTYKPVYQDEIREMVFAWERSARKLNGDYNEMLFTSQVEKKK